MYSWNPKRNRFSICKVGLCTHFPVIIGSILWISIKYGAVLVFYWPPGFGPIKLSNFIVRKILFFVMYRCYYFCGIQCGIKLKFLWDYFECYFRFFFANDAWNNEVRFIHIYHHRLWETNVVRLLHSHLSLHTCPFIFCTFNLAFLGHTQWAGLAWQGTTGTTCVKRYIDARATYHHHHEPIAVHYWT